MNALVPLPVLLPLLGAGLTLVLARRPRAQRFVTVAILVVVVALAVSLLVVVDTAGPLVVWIGGWNAPLGIALVADRLSTLMLLVGTTVALGVLIYSIGQGMTSDAEETPVSVYHPTFLVLVAGVSNAFLTGDLFNLFVSFEMLLFASYVLLTLGATESRIRAGTIYVVVSLLSSMLFLISIAAVYAATGTVNLARLSQELSHLPAGTALVLQLLLLTTFGVKAAVFPLCFWLPDSYPTAPAPVTAVFAGLLTKVGVYAILRTQTLLFPQQPLTELLLWVALLTMIVGILGAIVQSDIKRLLSFTLVSHIGYMVMGIALASEGGYSGAVFYVAHHITIQTALFLVVGLVEVHAGSTSLVRLGGLARVAPMLGLLFFVPAMNLAGIPPLSGFLGKVGLMTAGVQAGTPLALALVAGSAVTSLLTLYAITRTWALAFWRTPVQAQDMAMTLLDRVASGAPADRNAHPFPRRRDHATDAVLEARAMVGEMDAAPGDAVLVHARRLPATMVGAAASVVALSIALSIGGGPLFGFTDRVAHDLARPGEYAAAVLVPGGTR